MPLYFDIVYCDVGLEAMLYENNDLGEGKSIQIGIGNMTPMPNVTMPRRKEARSRPPNESITSFKLDFFVLSI